MTATMKLALAAAVAVIAGCTQNRDAGGSAGSGGNGGSAGTLVGDRFPQIDALVLTLNRVHDDGDQLGDEEYAFDVAELSVTHRWMQSSNPPTSLPPATREAMDALVATVQGFSYRFNEDCLLYAWDYVPFPPELMVRHDADRLVLGVSDSECAHTDHSFVGPVISCAAFEEVLAAVQQIVPEVESETCGEYW